MAIKCLIPAAGKGTRMKPFTHTLPKAMLPVAGKPMIYHIIDTAVSVGITDFVIITGYLRELMESEILLEYPSLNIKFIEQKEQKGLGHACYQAKESIQETDSLLIIYGDTLFKMDLKSLIQSSKIVISGSEVDDPKRFGIIELDSKNEYITNLIEKPEVPPTNLAIPGVNYFPSAKILFDSLKYIIDNDIKTKNEYQITDAFVHILKNNPKSMVPFKLEHWFDCGLLNTILDSNTQILSLSESVIKGQIINSKIIDPVYIEVGTTIENSIIGPNVSLAKNIQVKNSTLSNIIIDQNSTVSNATLSNSIIGRNVVVSNITGTIIIGDDGTLK